MAQSTLSEYELALIKDILSGVDRVFVFGSRIKGTSKQFSDLDICLKDPIAPYDFEVLQEKFEKSDLPFKVDLVEYDRVSKFFQRIIDEQGIDLHLL